MTRGAGLLCLMLPLVACADKPAFELTTSCTRAVALRFPDPTTDLLGEQNSLLTAMGYSPVRQWQLERSVEAPRGIVVVVHGLNVRAERMDRWGEELRHHGYDTLRITLEGHGGEPGAMGAATYDDWLTDLCVARAVARGANRGEEMGLLGFSLGGVVGLSTDAVSTTPWDFVTLLAPPLRTRLTARAVRALSLWPSLELDSGTPPPYRVLDATPVSADLAALAAGESSSHQQVAGTTRVWVALDPDDELVDSAGVAKLAVERQWTLWRIDTKTRPSDGPRHLMLDEESLGPTAFAAMSKSLAQFLDAKRASNTGQALQQRNQEAPGGQSP